MVKRAVLLFARVGRLASLKAWRTLDRRKTITKSLIIQKNCRQFPASPKTCWKVAVARRNQSVSHHNARPWQASALARDRASLSSNPFGTRLVQRARRRRVTGKKCRYPTPHAKRGDQILLASLSVQPILPPPCFVITTTDGRGGMLSAKSGQRVDGSS